MPRPRKCKRVCGMPLCSRFGPLDREPTGLVEMTVEEYETIRLMDLEAVSYTHLDVYKRQVKGKGAHIQGERHLLFLPGLQGHLGKGAQLFIRPQGRASAVPHVELDDLLALSLIHI